MKEIRNLIRKDDIQIRAEQADDGKRYLSGYAAVFNSRSKLIFERGRIFFEVIQPDAFNRVLEDPLLDVAATFNHDMEKILARTKSGTLDLSTDEKGLYFRFEVPNTTLGNDTFEMVRRGDFSECSFIFTVDDKGQKWERDGDDTIRYIQSVSRLYDVTICALNGAYGETTVDAEMAARAMKELEYQEKRNILEIQITDNQVKMGENSLQSLNDGIYQFKIGSDSGQVSGILTQNSDGTMVDFSDQIPDSGSYTIDQSDLTLVKDPDPEENIDLDQVDLMKKKLQLIKLKGQD